LRNAGKDPLDYNFDRIFDAAHGLDADDKTGGKCIDVMLAQTYDPEKHDPKGWLMSEKLDGVRCYWNGSAMYTRNKNIFYPPDWFKQ
jgi:DNA ligase-1